MELDRQSQLIWKNVSQDDFWTLAQINFPGIQGMQMVVRGTFQSVGDDPKTYRTTGTSAFTVDLGLLQQRRVSTDPRYSLTIPITMQDKHIFNVLPIGKITVILRFSSSILDELEAMLAQSVTTRVGV
jgi:hypothetical protein